jgi:hypothetical protein
LGVTPSALDVGKSFAVGFTGNMLWGATANNFQFMAGATYNNGYLYAVTGAAVSNYRQFTGQHQWFTAPSGTAGNAISFTQAMTLDASGNLALGTTSTSNITGWSGSATGQVIQGATPVLAIVDSDNTTNFVTWLANSGGITYLYNKANDALVFGTDNAERARITSGGDLLVGRTSTLDAGKFAIDFDGVNANAAAMNDTASANGSGFIRFYSGGTLRGSITNNNNAGVLYNVTSDQRLKENIQDADSASSLIDLLQVRKFDWKENSLHQRYGFVAQELVTVAPEAVHQPNKSDEMMAVDYSKLVPMLVKEIQSLRARVAQLETN